MEPSRTLECLCNLKWYKTQEKHLNSYTHKRWAKKQALLNDVEYQEKKECERWLLNLIQENTKRHENRFYPRPTEDEGLV